MGNSKKKQNQPQTPNEVQGRDLFQTPNYAVDLLIPYIPEGIELIWECACGYGKITNRLKERGFEVISTDINEEIKDIAHWNFLDTEINSAFGGADCIITNPPFSLKIQFYYKCRELNVPFALLVPADYAIWNIEAVWLDGAEKIIPHRRIDFITPTGKSGATGQTSQFHSMWLTWGFGLGRTETYVELTNEDKKNNI